MKPIRYHILLALARGPLHGAEIRRRVEEESGGALTLYPATLYGTIEELSAAESIAEVEPEVGRLGDGATRWRFYRLTREGRRALEAETARLEAVLGRARAALGPAAGGA